MEIEGEFAYRKRGQINRLKRCVLALSPWDGIAWRQLGSRSGKLDISGKALFKLTSQTSKMKVPGLGISPTWHSRIGVEGAYTMPRALPLGPSLRFLMFTGQRVDNHSTYTPTKRASLFDIIRRIFR